MSAVILPPSPNWYGSHLSDATPRHFVFCAHNSVVLLDTITLSVIDVLKGHNNRTTAVAFIGEEGRCIVSAASDKSMRVWMKTEESKDRFVCRRSLGKRPAEVKAVTSVVGEEIAVVGDVSGNVFIWDLGTASPLEVAKLVRLNACKQPCAITCLAAAPGPQASVVAVGCSNGSVTLIDWRCAQILTLLDRQGSDVHCLRWARLSFIRIRSRGELPLEEEKDDDVIKYSRSSSIDLLVSTSADGSILVYNTTLGVGERHEAHMSPSAVPVSGEGEHEEAKKSVCGFQIVGKLQIPPPPGGLGEGQKGRLWLPAAWSPVLIDPSSAWLLTGGYSGALFAWKIELNHNISTKSWIHAPPQCANKNNKPSGDHLSPVRIPSGHTRTVFSIHCFLDPGKSMAHSVALGGQPPPNAATFHPGLHILTIGMDRSARSCWAPLLALAPPGMPPECPAWHQQSARTCVGLGGYPLSISMRYPYSMPKGKTVHFPRLAVACGDATIRVLTFSTDSPVSPGWSTRGEGVRSPQPDSNVLLWQGIPAPVTVVTWHQTAEDILVFGCEDGSIGLVHCINGRCILTPVKHRAPVAALEWIETECNTVSQDLDCGDPYSGDDEHKDEEYERGDCHLVSMSSDGSLLTWKVWGSDFLKGMFPQVESGRQHYRQGQKGGGQAPGSSVSHELGKPSDSTGEALKYQGVTPTCMRTCSFADKRSRLFLFVGGAEGSIGVLTTGLAVHTVFNPCLPNDNPASVAHVSSISGRVVSVHDDGTLAFSMPFSCAGKTVAPRSVQLPAGAGQVNALSATYACLSTTKQREVVAALGMKDGTIQIWTMIFKEEWRDGVARQEDTTGGGGPVLAAKLRGHGASVLQVTWISKTEYTARNRNSSLPILISTAEDQTVRIWDVGHFIGLGMAADTAPKAREDTDPVSHSAHFHETCEIERYSAAGLMKEVEAEAVDADIPPPPPLPEEGPPTERPPTAPPLHGTPVDDEEQMGLGRVAGLQSLDQQLQQEACRSSRTASDQSAKKMGWKERTLGSKGILSPSPATAAEDIAHQKRLQAEVLHFAERCRLFECSEGGSAMPPTTSDYGHVPEGEPHVHDSHSFPQQLLECPFDSLDAMSTLHQAADRLADGETLAKLHPQQRRLQAQRAAALALWTGDVGGCIQILTDSEALTADFVSFSAAAGRAAWAAVSRAYAAQLEKLGEVHLAALHLLSIGNPSAACAVYSRAGMAREAATLAAARLPASDPEARRLRGVYAGKLEAKGEFELAAGHYLAAREWSKATGALKSRGSESAVRTASQLGRMLLHKRGELDAVEVEAMKLSEAGLLGRSATITEADVSHSVMDRGSSSRENLRRLTTRRRYATADLLALASNRPSEIHVDEGSVVTSIPAALLQT